MSPSAATCKQSIPIMGNHHHCHRILTKAVPPPQLLCFNFPANSNYNHLSNYFVSVLKVWKMLKYSVRAQPNLTGAGLIKTQLSLPSPVLNQIRRHPYQQRRISPGASSHLAPLLQSPLAAAAVVKPTVAAANAQAQLPWFAVKSKAQRRYCWCERKIRSQSALNTWMDAILKAYLSV